MMDDEEPLWKRIFLNEFLLVILAALAVLYLAFTLATAKKTEEPGRKPPAEGRP